MGVPGRVRADEVEGQLLGYAPTLVGAVQTIGIWLYSKQAPNAGPPNGR